MFKTNLNTILATFTLAIAGLLGSPAHAADAGLDRLESTPLALFAAPALEGKINVNQASVDQWELLPGIGPVTADRIVEYAGKRPFADTLHLLRVKGIGRKTYAKIKQYLTIDGPTTLRAVK